MISTLACKHYGRYIQACIWAHNELDANFSLYTFDRFIIHRDLHEVWRIDRGRASVRHRGETPTGQSSLCQELCPLPRCAHLLHLHLRYYLSALLGFASCSALVCFFLLDNPRPSGYLAEQFPPPFWLTSTAARDPLSPGRRSNHEVEHALFEHSIPPHSQPPPASLAGRVRVM
jgi:hypothetical protein